MGPILFVSIDIFSWCVSMKVLVGRRLYWAAPKNNISHSALLLRNQFLQFRISQITRSSHQTQNWPTSPLVGSLTDTCPDKLIFLHAKSLTRALPSSHKNILPGSWLNKARKRISIIGQYVVQRTILIAQLVQNWEKTSSSEDRIAKKRPSICICVPTQRSL